MLIKRRRGWEIPEREATPQDVYWNRRRFMRGMAAVAAGGVLGAGAGGGILGRASRAAATGEASEASPWADLYPVDRNARFKVERPLTDQTVAATYNNFYEFGSHKEIWRRAQALRLQPWTISIDGLVEKEITLDVDDLIRRMPLEERVYRHRCVEAWAMTVPWSGFPMKALVDLARPLSSAKYVRMESFLDPKRASGQRAFWYPWPYVEGLTMAEATNELTFLVTGIYGEPLPKQHGAPMRLSVPWKYGFKSVKSLVRFTFTDERPVSFWEEIAGNEYGFWANVNPEVAHPRWSQANERLIGTEEVVPTRIYNGYGPFVADIYAGIEGETLYR